MYNITNVIQNTIGVGVSLIILSMGGMANVIVYRHVSELMKDAKSTRVVNDVEIHFSNNCSKEFKESVYKIQRYAPLDRTESYVCAYDKWIKSGKWEECMKGDRV